MMKGCPNSFFNAFVDMRDFVSSTNGPVESDRKAFQLFTHKSSQKEYFVKQEKGITRNANGTKAFLREVETQLLLAHPSFSLFRGFCIGDDNQSAFYFFKCIKRGSLRTVMDKGLTVTEAACIIVGLPFLIEHMHKHKMAHRDIKPENILVDKHGHPWLTDFGCARELAPNIAATRSQGTEFYQSPQMNSDVGDLDTFKADMFSLGIVMAEAATGRYPFEVDKTKPAESIKGKVDVDKLDPERLDLFGLDETCVKPMLETPEGVWLLRVIAESAEFEAPDKVMQPPLLEIIKLCLSVFEEQRPTATELRERIEKLKPNELISWKHQFPDEKTVRDYMSMMQREFLSKK